MEYKRVAIGGTFDKLHKGHQAFLHYAFSLGEKVVIGLTSEAYVAIYKNKKTIEPFFYRKDILEKFLRREGLLQRAEIISIDDQYGPSISKSAQIDALVVTEDTFSGAEKINHERQIRGLSKLPVLIMPLVETVRIPISSSHIRKGLMDSRGTLILPEEFREVLKKPFGEIQKDLSFFTGIEGAKTVTVGDMTTKYANEKYMHQKISVVDFSVQRHKTYRSMRELGFSGEEKVIKAKNPAGHVTHDLYKAVLSAIALQDQCKNIILYVDGEEDLAVIPLAICLPNGFHIFYGQPDVGVVDVKVDTETKKKFQNILSHFVPETTKGS